jgi:hypothetical protein
MNKLIKNKGILIALTLFILATFLYNIFYKSETTPLSSELSATNIGDELLKTHRDLQAVTLDRQIFSSHGYLLLTDFGTAIAPQATGRLNPFDVIGRD